MEYCKLAPDLEITRIITGLWQVSDLERNNIKLDTGKAAATLANYAEAGFTTFDMADHYGSAEEIAGALKKSYTKKPTQLLTKWVPKPGAFSKDDVRNAVLLALSRMNVKTIDLLQFHAWNYADPRWLDCLFWLQELQDEGLIKHLGLTNFDAAHLRIVLYSGIKVVTNQVCYSLLDQRAAREMTALCLDRNVKLLAFGTLAGGFLSERWLTKQEPAELTTWSQMKYKRFIDVAGGWELFQELLKILDQVAKKNNVSLANIATRFILEQPAVGAVIVGARLGESNHSEDNASVFNFQLDEDSKDKINEALSRFNPIPGDCGDEYRKSPFLTASGDLSHHVENFTAPYPTKQGRDGRTKALSGTMWEDMAGFSRAVRKGNRILVSGTTATHGNRIIGITDPAAQAHFVIDKIEGAIQSLGGTLEDVVRTRIFVKNLSDWEPVARAHGQRFRDIQPANTLVSAALVGEEYLIEMEADAVVGV